MSGTLGTSAARADCPCRTIRGLSRTSSGSSRAICRRPSSPTATAARAPAARRRCCRRRALRTSPTVAALWCPLVTTLNYRRAASAAHPCGRSSSRLCPSRRCRRSRSGTQTATLGRRCARLWPTATSWASGTAQPPRFPWQGYSQRSLSCCARETRPLTWCANSLLATRCTQ